MKQRLYPILMATASLLIFVVVATTVLGDNVVNYIRYRSLITKPPESKIQIPIRGVLPKQIADTWHASRGADRRHEGQDIFARRYTPVYSATEGYVIDIGENKLGGKTVSVIGAGGRVYYYAHLHAYGDMVEGDLVSPDTILGYVGTTGNAAGTPPHLHFGVYTLTGPINPLTLF